LAGKGSFGQIKRACVCGGQASTKFENAVRETIKIEFGGEGGADRQELFQVLLAQGTIFQNFFELQSFLL